MKYNKILVVDDDDDVRESLVDELCGQYSVEAAASGSEALEILKTERYDAVISDLRMPEVGGIEVLESAKAHDPEVVRILLTGYLDEDARRATLEPDAPFKIGKPWHDEIEVTLRRAFEFRETKRRLSSTVLDALTLSGIDDDLAAADGMRNISEVVVSKVCELQGVKSAWVNLEVCGNNRMLAGTPDSQPLPPDSDAWDLCEPLTHDQSATLHVLGHGDDAQGIVRFVAQRARYWTREDDATRLARKANALPEAKTRLSAMIRRASLGAMTAALVHELASVVQSLQGAVYDLDFFVRATADDEEVIESLDTVTEMSKRMMALFRAMRTFVRSRGVNHQRCRVEELIERAITLCHGQVRSQATVELSEVPDVEIDVSEPLFLQVLVNLLRNAADASPRHGIISVDVTTSPGVVSFTITDDGPGVSEDLADTLFEPFVTSKEVHSGSGLGLAISSQIVADHGGSIHYERAPGRGARFVVSLPTPADADESAFELPS